MIEFMTKRQVRFITAFLINLGVDLFLYKLVTDPFVWVVFGLFMCLQLFASFSFALQGTLEPFVIDIRTDKQRQIAEERRQDDLLTGMKNQAQMRYLSGEIDEDRYDEFMQRLGKVAQLGSGEEYV